MQQSYLPRMLPVGLEILTEFALDLRWTKARNILSSYLMSWAIG